MNVYVTTAIFGFLAVGIGAFGAHALGDSLSPKLLSAYKTGVEYHFYHVFAAFIVLLVRQSILPSPLLTAACMCFLVGIVLFSGSLYAMGVFNKPMLGMITPIGGLSFLAGWALFAYAMLKV